MQGRRPETNNYKYWNKEQDAILHKLCYEGLYSYQKMVECFFLNRTPIALRRRAQKLKYKNKYHFMLEKNRINRKKTKITTVDSAQTSVINIPESNQIVNKLATVLAAPKPKRIIKTLDDAFEEVKRPADVNTVPTTIDQVLKQSSLSKFGTFDEAEFKDKIDNIARNETDFRNYCLEHSLRPDDNIIALKEKLLDMFREYTRQTKCRLPKLPTPKQPSKQAIDFAAAGR